jgi:hypothetical protein
MCAADASTVALGVGMKVGLTAQQGHRMGASVLTGHQRLQEVDDLLLAYGCCVEFAAHLDEPVVYLVEAVVDAGEAVIDAGETGVHLGSQIIHVVAQGVGAPHGGLAEVAELGMELRDVAVSCAGEDAGRSSILFARLDPSGKVTHLRLQCLHAGFKAVRLHEREPTALEEGR